MSLEFPEDRSCENINSQFMFGESLLIAPVVEEGAIRKKVYLPRGNWIDFNSPEKSYVGGTWMDYPVELKTIPMFVKCGSIIPTMPVMEYIGQQQDYPLILEIFPALINKKASFEVYEDDGESNDYKKEICAKREVQCESQKDLFKITYNEKSINNFQIKERNLIFHIHLDKAPAAVFIEDKKIKISAKKEDFELPSLKTKKSFCCWDKSTSTLMMLLPEDLKNKIVTIEK
jgi:alpha-glucosidase